MLLRGRVLAVVLTVIMMLTFGLMMLAPASAGAFPGKNGKIVFSALDAPLPSGISQIFVMNPDGTDVQQLTYSKSTYSFVPAWSPDGTKIAYSNSSISPGPSVTMTIWVMNADGSGAHQIASGLGYFDPDWSPDGTKIAFTRLGTGLYVMNADGSAQTQLTSATSDSSPSWSPDGTKIAFSRGVSPPSLYVLTVATPPSVAPLLATWSIEPCWSPDGSKIVFIGNTPSWGIYWVSASGGTPTLIRSDPSFSYDMPDWSPDGTKIAFSNGMASIYVMNADGSNLIDSTPDMPTAEAPNWQRLPATPVVGPVGGFMEPVNKLVVLAPYLALFGLVATVAVVAVKPWKKTHN